MAFDPIINDPVGTNNQHFSSMSPVILKSEGKKLLGTFFTAAGEEKKPTVILLHGFPGNENNFDIAHSICRAGWNVLVFYYRGAWGSEGTFSWQNAIEDVNNVVESIRNGWLSEELKADTQKIVIVGHSMGGFFAAWALVKKLVDHVFTIGLFNLGFVGELIAENETLQAMAMESLVKGSEILKTTGAGKLLEEMISNGSNWNLITYGQKLSEKDFYMVAGSKDQTSPLDLHHNPLINVLKKNNPNKNYGKIFEAGHSFIDKRIEMSRTIINWLNQITF